MQGRCIGKAKISITVAISAIVAFIVCFAFCGSAFAAGSNTLDIKNIEKGDSVSIAQIVAESKGALSFINGACYDSQEPDKGFDKYSRLEYDSDKRRAADIFASQIADNSFSTPKTAADNIVEFTGLAKGQYLIKAVSADGTRKYQNIIASVGIQGQPNEVDASLKYIPIELGEFAMSIEKKSDKKSYDKGQYIKYELELSTTQSKYNESDIHIQDTLSKETVSAGIFLMQDVKIRYDNGTSIENADVEYIMDGDETIGYDIVIPKDDISDDVIIITYTGSTDDIACDINALNRVTASTDTGASSEDEHEVACKAPGEERNENADNDENETDIPDGFADTSGEDNAPEKPDQIQNSVFSNTGDILVSMFLGMGSAAIAAFLILIIAKYRSRKHSGRYFR